ncbi:polysaccharide biosynthesis protein, partial [Lachnospiraceae bacterium 45-P1]
MYEILQKYLPKDKRIRMLILMAADAAAIWMASFLGLFVRFDMNLNRIPAEYNQATAAYFPYYLLITLLIFFLFRMYSTMWSVAGIREVVHIIGACGLASLVQVAGMMLLEFRVPRSFFLICFAALCAEEILIRLSHRIALTV